jgi:hypothetical protein
MTSIGALRGPDVSPASWNLTGTAAVNASNQVSLPCDLTYSSQCWSAAAYDLTGSSISVKIPQLAGTNNSTAVTAFGVSTTGPGGTTALRMFVANASLTVLHDVSGTTTTVVSLPYKPVFDTAWRFRESGGTTYYETSADGINFTAIASEANPITVTSLYVGLWCGYASGTTPSPANALYSEFNAVTGSWDLISNIRGGAAGIVPVYAGSDASAPRPSGAAVVYWIMTNSTTPTNAITADIVGQF